MFVCTLSILSFYFYIQNFAVSSLTTDLYYKSNFELGKSAYLSQRWQDCVNNLEKVLIRHENVKDLIAECQLSCYGSVDLPTEGFGVRQLSVKLTLIESCFEKCENGFDNKFSRFDVYSLLQHCYYQNHQAQDAASAVFTILRASPDDKKMSSYLRFYTGLPEVDANKVEDLERDSNSALLLDQAMTSIDEGRFLAAIELTEKSLDGYLRKMARCRIGCQRPGPSANVNSTAQAAFVLELACKQRCSHDGVDLKRGAVNSLLTEHYHYLQYSYLNVGKVWPAVMAAASLALVSPLDTRALTAIEEYQRLLDAKGAKFPPRKEAIEFARRCQMETKLLHLVDGYVSDNLEGAANGCETVFDKLLDSMPEACHRHVTSLDADPQGMDTVIREQVNEILCNNPTRTWTQSIDLLENTPKTDLSRNFPKPEPFKRRALLDPMALRHEFLRDIVLLKTGEELGGRHRVLAEGFANDQECRKLVELAEATLVPGHGHGGVAMPFSRFEIHAGVGFPRATNMTLSGEIGPELVDILIDIGDRAKAFLEKHFALQDKLYFQFSELVCRTSTIATLQGQHDDVLSHPVHADNCHVTQDGRCEPYSHSSTLQWREYSSLTYLNDDFEGGEFFFAANESLASVQAVVRPKCGRMVAFTSSVENLHGVHGVRNGRRCAVATWFTTARAQLETSRVDAQLQRDKMRLDALFKVN